MYHPKIDQWSEKTEEKCRLICAAIGDIPADLVLKNATYVNVFSQELCQGDIALSQGRIVGIGTYQGKEERDVAGKLVLPGFIDAHIHLESSLVSPAEFTRAVLPHGTTAVVTDPHEIANVMGTDGIEYLLQATEGLPIDVRFMLPSCVPATPLDESGAALDAQTIDRFYLHPRICGLAEMMNAYGVTHLDKSVVEKIVAAQSHGKGIDGHAPGLSGKELNAYIASGVCSDHECFALDDAQNKLRRGQFIMIREGTAARNLEALSPLLCEKTIDRCMFCTDDKHPNDLLEKGHLDYIVKKAISLGVDPILAVKAASLNAARYFGLKDQGAIAPGYWGDLVIIDNFEHFHIEQVYHHGSLACENGMLTAFSTPTIDPALITHSHNTFHVSPLTPDKLNDGQLHGVIGMVPGEIISTDAGVADHVDLENDILKIAVIERHKGTDHIGIGYIKGYGLQHGAVATSISHDSHNIIVVGTNDADMAAAVNQVVTLNGGIVVVDADNIIGEVPLAIAGIMSDEPLSVVNEKLEAAKDKAFTLGVSRDIDPFMTLSFMALSVIPTLRITTKGVYDVNSQQFI